MIDKVLQNIILGNTVKSYLIATVIALFGIIAIKIIERIIIKNLVKWADKTKNTIDDFFVGLVKEIVVPLSYFGSVYLAVNTLAIDPLGKKLINIVSMGVLVISAARLVTVLISYAFKVYWLKRGKDLAFEASLKGILRVINFVVWALAIVFFLDNLGFKISAVIAGLGIGGVAVALAAQAVLGDLFSYFAILFDRPFEIGDFIIVGEYLGVVQHIGIKTTRISSLSGEQLIFSNSDLTNSRVRNYKRMEKRRVVFKLGVTYDTPLAKLKEIPDLIKNIITNIEDATFDRAHFFSYGDFNLVIEVVYYVTGGDYNKYMDIQQIINFKIKEEFEKRKIEFAFPTQTLYVNKSS